jgi:hypothetical protein
MDEPCARKPRLYFDTALHANHITFDDGKEMRRNIPWTYYAEARWEFEDDNLIKMEIGDWLVILKGHNLAPLFQAIEERTLTRVRAHGEWQDDPERTTDTYVTEIQFLKPLLSMPGRRHGQSELNLGLPSVAD